MALCAGCEESDNSGGGSSCESLYACDSCELSFCQKCSHLTTTEMRAALLKKRSMIFLCSKCRGCFDVFVKGRDEVGADDVGAEPLEVTIRKVIAAVLQELVPDVLGAALLGLSGRVADIDSKFDDLARSFGVLTRSCESLVLKHSISVAHKEAVPSLSSEPEVIDVNCQNQIRDATAVDVSLSVVPSAAATCQVSGLKTKTALLPAPRSKTGGTVGVSSDGDQAGRKSASVSRHPKSDVRDGCQDYGELLAASEGALGASIRDGPGWTSNVEDVRDTARAVLVMVWGRSYRLPAYMSPRWIFYMRVKMWSST